MRYVCVHGHFYQPPRENPSLEAVELQDSAYPYHDWNERITAECYAPNATSRIVDGEQRILQLVNNYAEISFNFGPTLLSWLESKAPRVYESILRADKQSRERFSGHGNAIAQAYNHMILPLANKRDKTTQVKWGISDFEFRFGRKPEGMWLPGNCGQHRNSGSPRRKRHQIHHSRAPPGETRSQKGWPRVERYGWRQDRS